MVGCRILIPREVYEIPPLGTLALHDSLLPDYRGFAPLNWSILNGEDHTGVTLFYLSELTDGGDIVAQKRVPIGPHDTAPVVYERVVEATVQLIREAYPLLAQGAAPRIRQDYTSGGFTCSRRPADGVIDWSKPTRDIYNQIRALAYPYPGAFTFHDAKKLIIWRAIPVQNPPNYVGRIPGRVVGISRTEGHVDVLTGDGILRLFDVESAGQERTAAATVIRSVKTTLGLRVIDLLARIGGLEQQIARLRDGAHNDG